MKWQATIEVRPYSTDRGREKDQDDVGERVRTYDVHADDIEAALKLVKLLQTGIQASPMVWQAPITSIVMVR